MRDEYRFLGCFPSSSPHQNERPVRNMFTILSTREKNRHHKNRRTNHPSDDAIDRSPARLPSPPPRGALPRHLPRRRRQRGSTLHDDRRRSPIDDAGEVGQLGRRHEEDVDGRWDDRLGRMGETRWGDDHDHHQEEEEEQH